MAIIRQKRKDRFLVVDNKIIEDKRLSFKARGLLIYMLSKPDDWKFWTSELVKRSAKDGISSIRTALKELETAGYLTRKRERSSKGTFTSQDWILTDKPTFQPQVEKPHVDKPQVEKPHVDNHTLPNTDFKPNTDIPNTNITTTTPTNFNNATTAQSGGSQKHSHEDVYDRWQKDWGFPNTFIREDLEKWLAAFGNDVVYYTIEYALSKDVKARNADSFLNTVFENYASKKILTVDDAKKVNAAFDSRNNNYQKGNYVPRKPRKKRIYD